MRPPHQNNRAFGFTFAGVFLLLSGVWWLASGSLLTWALATSATLATLALILPGLLLPLNLLWRKLAWRLAALNTYLILGILFYGVLTPIGVLMRLFGRDPMQRATGDADTDYWSPVRRQAHADTLVDQF